MECMLTRGFCVTTGYHFYYCLFPFWISKLKSISTEYVRRRLWKWHHIKTNLPSSHLSSACLSAPANRMVVYWFAYEIDLTIWTRRFIYSGPDKFYSGINVTTFQNNWLTNTFPQKKVTYFRLPYLPMELFWVWYCEPAYSTTLILVTFPAKASPSAAFSN